MTTETAGGVGHAVVVYGTVPELDQQANTFHLRLADGTRLHAPVAARHAGAVWEAFAGYRAGTRVRVHAVGLYDRAGRPTRLAAVEHVAVLDPLDVGARVDELKALGRGWLDGKGAAPDPGLLDGFAAAFDREYPDGLPLPHLYPTPEGGLRAEWSVGRSELSLELAPGAAGGRWHALDLADDAERAEDVNLNTPAGWGRLAELIRAAGGGA